MRRVVIPELLDSDAGTPDEIAASLADLRRINRWFGGVSTTCALIEQVARQTGRREFSLLDVAAGSGDVAEAARQRLQRQGIRISVNLLDRARSHLNGARPSVVGDALALPFADNSLDLVTCALFVHHLEPSEVTRYVDEALRVCRVAVLINDLRRSALHLASVYGGFPLLRSRITRHDGPASVRRAYTQQELLEILRRTKATRIEAHKHYLFRMGVIAWKAAP